MLASRFFLIKKINLIKRWQQQAFFVLVKQIFQRVHIFFTNIETKIIITFVYITNKCQYTISIISSLTKFGKVAS